MTVLSLTLGSLPHPMQLRRTIKLFVYEFLQCSVKCGTGHMTRVARCIDAQGNVVDDKKCTADTKPVVTKQCYKNGDYCQLLWQYTPWSEVCLTALLGSLMP